MEARHGLSCLWGLTCWVRAQYCRIRGGHEMVSMATVGSKDGKLALCILTGCKRCATVVSESWLTEDAIMKGMMGSPIPKKIETTKEERH